MLATGNVREVFDLKSFVKRHPNIFPKLPELRKTMNVLVLQSRCPVKQALDNVDKDNTDTTVAPQLSSQTFWTTLQSWISKQTFFQRVKTALKNTMLSSLLFIKK